MRGERSIRLEQIRQFDLASRCAAHLGARWANPDVIGGHFKRGLRQFDQPSASFARYSSSRPT